MVHYRFKGVVGSGQRHGFLPNHVAHTERPATHLRATTAYTMRTQGQHATGGSGSRCNVLTPAPVAYKLPATVRDIHSPTGGVDAILVSELLHSVLNHRTGRVCVACVSYPASGAFLSRTLGCQPSTTSTRVIEKLRPRAFHDLINSQPDRSKMQGLTCAVLIVSLVSREVPCLLIQHRGVRDEHPLMMCPHCSLSGGA